MSERFDSRITAARPDVADWSLRGRVQARRYVHPTPYRVVRDGAPLVFNASLRARQESQLLYGETFNVYERQGDWCWGQNTTDGYVGFVLRNHLSRNTETPNHRVRTLSTFCYPRPDIKAPVDRTISIGSLVTVSDQDGDFLRIEGGDWVYAKHLTALEEPVEDYIATALTLLGVPYLWGGRSSRGVDCSALVQIALTCAGIDAPRDSDLQEIELGEAVPQDGDVSDVREGDLIFFPGHVGFVIDNWRFLHANAHDMQVSIHGLSEVLDRARKSNAPPSSVRRLNQAIFQ